jgi:hypothetical protein
MRKGYIMIVCRDDKQKDYLFEYINNKLNKYIIRKSKNKYFDYSIEINGYYLLFKLRYPMNMRGYRPEIIYIDKWADVTLEDYHDIVLAKVLLSNRKIPIRFGDLYSKENGIDLKELIDDKYAINNTCDIEKVKEWETKYK